MISILFTHPDEKLSQIYTSRLKTQFQVDSAYDGLSALRRLKTSKPSIVISDYHLPILSGIALLRFMRSSNDFSFTPFIFLSDHHDNSEALNLGANDWLDIKSTHPDRLMECLHHHLKANKYGLQIHRA